MSGFPKIRGAISGVPTISFQHIGACFGVHQFLKISIWIRRQRHEWKIDRYNMFPSAAAFEHLGSQLGGHGVTKLLQCESYSVLVTYCVRNIHPSDNT